MAITLSSSASSILPSSSAFLSCCSAWYELSVSETSEKSPSRAWPRMMLSCGLTRRRVSRLMSSTIKWCTTGDAGTGRRNAKLSAHREQRASERIEGG
eukprot:4066147-Prymnesium_polylepis.1